MRADKKTKLLAKQLFKLSLVNGQVSAEQVAGVLGYIEKIEPRHPLALLKLYHRAIQTEVAKSRALVEHAGPVGGGNPGPVIGDRDHRSAIHVFVRNDDLPAGAAMLDRIVDEVGDGIKDQITIASHQHLAIADNGETGAVRFGRGIVQLDNLTGDFGQIHGAERALSRLGLNLRNPGKG